MQNHINLKKLFFSSIIKITISSVFILFICGCMQSTIVKYIDRSKEIPDYVEAQTIVHLIDYRTILFKKGFSVDESGKNISGIAKTKPGKSIKTHLVTIPIDSIAAIIYYDKGQINRSYIAGTTILGLTGPALSAFGYFCTFCPKCCFGSCPTVYTVNDKGLKVLTAELFSKSIASSLEAPDIDLLDQNIKSGTEWSCNITNEALETHWINRFSLIAVPHDINEFVFPIRDTSLIAVKNLQSFQKVVSTSGEDLSVIVKNSDSLSYRSNQTLSGTSEDWIDISLPTPDEADSLAIIIKSKNTLLSTILLYEVVLGSQGIFAINWLEKLNKDSTYANLFRKIYDNYSGIKVQTYYNGKWQNCGKFHDTGPIAWRDDVIIVPIFKDLNIQKYRLTFFPDNQMIDKLAFSLNYRYPNNEQIIAAELLSIKDNSGNEREDVKKVISSIDSLYIETNPSDEFLLRYQLPENDSILSLFVKSQGHYTEWIRSSWLKNSFSSNYKFNLQNINATIIELAEKWNTSRIEIEQEFFKNRIPIKENKNEQIKK